MPRRAPKNVFDVSRTDKVDAPAQSVAPAPALESLLRRVEPVVTPGVGRGEPPLSQTASRQTGQGAPRGVGGRPRLTSAAGRITAVPARVPGPLYDAALPLVKGVGRPSWGQLVAWTCQDHPEGVRAEITALAEAVVQPRRLRGPNREGEASMQVTARFLPAELAVFDSARDGVEHGDVVITRTMVVIAALTVATNR